MNRRLNAKCKFVKTKLPLTIISMLLLGVVSCSSFDHDQFTFELNQLTEKADNIILMYNSLEVGGSADLLTSALHQYSDAVAAFADFVNAQSGGEEEERIIKYFNQEYLPHAQKAKNTIEKVIVFWGNNDQLTSEEEITSFNSSIAEYDRRLQEFIEFHNGFVVRYRQLSQQSSND